MLAGLVLPLIVQASLVQLTTSQCRTGWTLHNGKCYGFSADEVSWGDALRICQMYGGTLAEPRDALVQDWLLTQMKNRQIRFEWIGGTDIFHEGAWVWISDKTAIGSFNRWLTVEPNDLNGEDCMTLWDEWGNYDWNDAPCNYKLHFICQVNAV